PDVGDAPSGQSIERTDAAGTWQIQSTPTPGTTPFGGGGGGTAEPLLSEVFYDPPSGDNGLEWVELKNDGTASVDLSGYCIGNGGGDYTASTVQLTGTLAAGATFVVGGTTSNSSNGNPTFDQSVNFSPDFQNSGSTADGVALFDVPCSSVTGSTVPVDAVIYGVTNSSNLLDESGAAGTPDVGDAPAGQSIERTSSSGAWQIQSSPSPGTAAF
ncbi:MAG: lamin tail domain-containing protein, partial [Acidobacteriota bacterium]